MDERNDGARLEAMFDARHEGQYRRVEVITGPVRRRNWTNEEKARMLAESAEPDANISAIARRFGVNRGLLNTWRRAAGQIGPASAVAAVEQPAFVPVMIAAHQNERHADEADASEGTAGRIEIELGGGRMIVTGNVAPDLAHAVVTALRGRR
ncbi:MULTISPECIES: IS66-like element accessory protein TnpA [Rhizobiaceae]|jgi:transposase